ncbi:MAG: inner membrane-spanning protein YciB [Pseudomonadota bacterium]
MQQLLDYIAILAFVVIYFLTRDIFLATGVLMVGVTIQVAAYWFLKKPIGNELKLTFWASMILGGMTLILRDETFIQWKPTIVNWLLALVLVVAHLWRRVYLIQKMLGKVLKLPDQAWFVLTYGWAGAFVFAGMVNLYVAFNYSMDTWVTFKFVGLMGLNILYLIATFTYLGVKGWLTDEHLQDPDADKSKETDTDLIAAKDGD